MDIDENNADAFKSRGDIKECIGDYQGAITDHNRALEINPNYVRAYVSRGIAKSGLGDLEGTADDFNKAMMIDPEILFLISFEDLRGLMQTIEMAPVAIGKEHDNWETRMLRIFSISIASNPLMPITK